MGGSAMESLVRWTIIGLELASLAAISGEISFRNCMNDFILALFVFVASSVDCCTHRQSIQVNPSLVFQTN
ncbi:MAG: hypothetical protein MK186_13885, partial [Henriciella sp.]|nr:hypothetical protein [Henriciella sp.]